MMETTRSVVIGGGTGTTRVLRALGNITNHRTAIIAVTDNGRSTRIARMLGNIPAPGDIRSTIASFSANPLTSTLLQHRLGSNGVDGLQGIEGMAFGNLLIAALAQVTGSFDKAVQTTSELADCQIEVLPISLSNVELCARLSDSQEVEGEVAVSTSQKARIREIFLSEPAPAHLPALQAIQEAELVILGPGSLFTSVLTNLLFEGVVDALRKTNGKVVYVCNTAIQQGETDGFTVYDHVEQVSRALGQNGLDYALINNASSPLHSSQDATGDFSTLQPSQEEIAQIEKLGVTPFVTDLLEASNSPRSQSELWNKPDSIRHDEYKLEQAFRTILGQ